MNKWIGIITSSIIFVFIIVVIINNISNFSSDFDDSLLKENESRLYKYDANCNFTNEDIDLITEIFYGYNIFEDNEIIINNTGRILINYALNDYDTEGTIFLYVDTPYYEAREILKSKISSYETVEYNDSIVFDGKYGIIMFYIDSHNNNVITISTTLPFIYTNNYMNTENSLVKYFLKLNEENKHK